MPASWFVARQPILIVEVQVAINGSREAIWAATPNLLDYVTFHLTVVVCPYCQANLDDLKKLGG